MILIADCGSTKADWRLVGGSEGSKNFNTKGFNPFLHSTETIREGLNESLAKQLDTSLITKVFFYGAGCSDAYRCSIVENALTAIFPNALINIDHDLLAAARATCGNHEGIACILGTGSNSCLYDGSQIIDNVTNLGHIIGDEGSGYHLGKSLVQAYFYRELPVELNKAFEEFCTLGKREILNRIYRKGNANVFLSSFAKLIAEQKSHPFIQKLVFNCFDLFVKRHVCKYENYNKIPVSFIGSIAFHFKEVLEQVLVSHSIELGKILKKPIDELVIYHNQSDKIMFDK